MAQGTVPALETRQAVVEGATIEVSWELVQPVVGDSAIGDAMNGRFDAVRAAPRLTFEVDNIVGDDWYFAPVITNKRSEDMLMGVNMGLAAENRCPCTVPAGGSNIGLGYYHFFSNSNVRGYRGGTGYTGRYSYWENMTVEAGSGRIHLIADP